MTQPPPPSKPPITHYEPSWREALVVPLGLLGGILGAVAGALVYHLLWMRAGLQAPFVPGVFVGIGTRYLARTGSLLLAAISFVIALAGALIAQWTILHNPDPLAQYLMHAADAFTPWGWAFALGGAGAAAFLTYAAPPRA